MAGWPRQPTIKGGSALGEPILANELPTIDLVVAGSVAVNLRGARVGKGGGYSDLEFALARELGRVRENTPVLTTVHELQILDEDLPMTNHDVPLDLIVTPHRVLRTARAFGKPAGIRWEQLSASQLEAMPALQTRKAADGGWVTPLEGGQTIGDIRLRCNLPVADLAGGSLREG